MPAGIRDVENPRAIPVVVNGKNYAATWQDFGTYKRINVFEINLLSLRLIGFKDYPIRVDTGMGTIMYSVKSILEGGRNGLIKKGVAKKV